jgi:L-fuculose-phosphate aldolase
MGSRDEARAGVVEACRRIVAVGLVSGASGNVSRRLRQPDGELVAITPTRVPYSRLRVEDVLVIDFDAEPVEGEGVPSSETLTHLAVYRARPDVGAVIHTHSVYASVLAVAGLEIPPLVDEQVVALGGAVAVAEYGMSASEDLARKAVAALGERNAVLLRNHGVVGVGVDLEEAAAVCELVERLAKIHVHALALGRASPLPEDVVATETKLYRMLRGRMPSA